MGGKSIGPLVPENFIRVPRKYFPKKEKKDNCKIKTLANRKDITCTCRYMPWEMQL
jgi:hypothetical protein